MQSNNTQNELLFSIEERTIRHAESIIVDDNYKENQLLKEYTKLYKRYKKLFKQLKNLISMTDRQQKQVKNLNNELLQTNKLLSGLGGEKSLTINSQLVNQMSNYTSQLILTKNHLLSVCQSDQQKSDYLGLLQNLNIVTTNLQDCIFQTKMQPLAIVYAGLPKKASQAAKLNQKEIQLNLSGKNVRIDNDFLESLSFILSHLIENACKHGIESKKERLELNKDPIGNIDITAYKKDRHIYIEVNDDGRGLELQSVFEKNNIENTTSIELNQLIDQLAISNESFSRSSGLKRIHQMVEDMKGNIKIHSQQMQGLRYILKFPESISIISGLIVDVLGERFILPQDSIVELISVYDSDIFTQIEYTHESEVIRLRDKLIPLIRLNEVVKLRKQFTSDIRIKIVQKYSRIMNEKQHQINTDATLLLVVLKADNDRFALIIDQIIGNEEIVYMPLHPLVKHLNIYTGLSILGDGSVSMILNPLGIFKHVDIHIDNSGNDKSKTQHISTTQRILLFQSGIKEQYAVLLSEIYRLVRIKKSDIQYKSNTPLIAIDGVVTQVIILDHFLSVSKFISNDILYLLILKNMDRPLGILMSSLAGIHRIEISLETDTYVAEGVRGTMKTNGRLTIFLDASKLAQMARIAYMNKKENNDDHHL